MRHAKSFLSRAACKVPHCQKWDCHALPLFALDRAIPRLFSISILIAGETKNGRAKSTRWSVWQPCFWGCDMTLRTPPAASKVHQNNETTKAKKDDTNIHVLNCCVESFLLKINNLSIHLRHANRASCLEQTPQGIMRPQKPKRMTQTSMC